MCHVKAMTMVDREIESDAPIASSPFRVNSVKLIPTVSTTYDTRSQLSDVMCNVLRQGHYDRGSGKEQVVLLPRQSIPSSPFRVSSVKYNARVLLFGCLSFLERSE